MNQETKIIRFGVFEVSVDAGELRKQGQKVKLQEKPFQALTLMLQHAGRIVTREELCRRLWTADTFVEFDDNLNATIKRLREALKDSADSPRYIETVPRRGYRFIAPVEVVRCEHEPAETALPTTSVARPRRPLLVQHRPLLVAVLLLTMLLITVLLWRSEYGQRVYASRTITLAVLPMANQSGDNGQDFLTDGMTEDLIGHLRQLYPERLVVIASDSVSGYKNTNKDLHQIEQELGIDYIVRSTLDRDPDGAFITTELIQTGNENPLWSEKFKLPVQELFVEYKASQKVAEALELKPQPKNKTELSRSTTGNNYAFEAYLRGLSASQHGTEDNLRSALGWFEQALRHDPQYALAYAGIARAWISLGDFHFIDSSQVELKVGDAISKGMQLDPAISDFYILQAEILAKKDGNHEKVDAAFRRAIELDPNNAEAHEKYALYLRERRPNDAASEITKARQLNPLSPWETACAGWVLIASGRLDEAAVLLDQAFRMDPKLPATMKFLSDLEQKRGHTDAAIDWLERAASASDRTPRFLYYLARTYAKAGRADKVRILLDELRQEQQHRYVDPEYINSLGSMLGD